MKSNIKDESIKIRLTKHEKEQLQNQATAANKNLSAYVLQKSLCSDSICQNSFTDVVEASNLLNEIYHEIQKCGDEHLKNFVKSILGRSRKNGH